MFFIIRMSSWLLLWQWKTKGPSKVRNFIRSSAVVLSSSEMLSLLYFHVSFGTTPL